MVWLQSPGFGHSLVSISQDEHLNKVYASSWSLYCTSCCCPRLLSSTPCFSVLFTPQAGSQSLASSQSSLLETCVILLFSSSPYYPWPKYGTTYSPGNLLSPLWWPLRHCPQDDLALALEALVEFSSPFSSFGIPPSVMPQSSFLLVWLTGTHLQNVSYLLLLEVSINSQSKLRLLDDSL